MYIATYTKCSRNKCFNGNSSVITGINFCVALQVSSPQYLISATLKLYKKTCFFMNLMRKQYNYLT